MGQKGFKELSRFVISNEQAMPGLESVLLAVYSEGEGKDLVEVRRLVLQQMY